MKLGLTQLCINNTSELSLVKSFGIDFIEVVLPKISEWDDLTAEKVAQYINILDQNGLKAISTQSVTYGSNLSSLSSIEFITHMKKIIDVCNVCGINTIVLGSPTLRKGTTNSLVKVFNLLEDYLQEKHTTICIEPNSQHYGGDYFYTIDEVVDFIKEHKYQHIKTMIDTANVLFEKDKPQEKYIEHLNNVAHIHISEKDLRCLNKSSIHVEFANILKLNKYEGLVTYEVKEYINDSFIDSLNYFTKTYNT